MPRTTMRLQPKANEHLMGGGYKLNVNQITFLSQVEIKTCSLMMYVCIGLYISNDFDRWAKTG
jgi:hypothetical protein